MSDDEERQDKAFFAPGSEGRTNGEVEFSFVDYWWRVSMMIAEEGMVRGGVW